MLRKARLKFKYAYFVFLPILLGCSTMVHKEGAEQKRLSLASAERLKPGTTSKDDVIRLLGNPDKVVPAESGVAVAHRDEVWLYLNEAKDSTRVSLVFDQHSTLLKTNWFIESGDPEANLQTLLSRYSSGSFVRTPVPWTNDHFAPNEEIYKDATLGIEIVHAKGNQFVESIVFLEPIHNPTAGK